MSSSEIILPLGVDQIKKLIPHRYPFLLVDRIVDFKAGEHIVGVKNVTVNEPFFVGHFPAMSVMPGVLQIEALAQTSAVYGRLVEPDIEGCLLTEVSNARFRRMVIPGDALRLQINVEKRRRNFFWFAAKAYVEDQITAEVQFSAKLG